MYIDEQLKEKFKKELSLLTKNVKIVFFTQELECMLRNNVPNFV